MQPNVCLTPTCIQTASSFISSIDNSSTADPCESFYDYAVGSWLKEAHIPRGETRWGMMPQMIAANERFTLDILRGAESEAEDGYDEEILGKMRRFHQSCVDVEGVDASGDEPLEGVVKEIVKLYLEGGLSESLGYMHVRGTSPSFPPPYCRFILLN